MADTTALKNRIRAAIKANDNQEITGPVLQQALLDMVDELDLNPELQQAINTEKNARQSSDEQLQQAINSEAQTRQSADTQLNNLVTGIKTNIDNGYVYAGIATPSTIPVSGKVFYLALTAGTYTNFGNTTVTQGINILKYNGSAWSLDAFVGIDDTIVEGSKNLAKSGAVAKALDKVSEISKNKTYDQIPDEIKILDDEDNTIAEITPNGCNFKNLQSNGKNVFDEVMKNGSAFDLSAYNGGATYADLNAALTALNALPTAYKRGGMSMKFVLSSDNKYVQFRLTANQFTTDITKWQSENADDTIVEGSKNLAKSGAVAKALDKVSEISKNKTYDQIPDEIKILDDEDNTIAEITPNGCNFKNLQSNGKNVVATNKISETESTNENEEQIWQNNEGTEDYAKIGSYGVKAKGYFDLNGSPIDQRKRGILINGNTYTHFIVLNNGQLLCRQFGLGGLSQEWNGLLDIQKMYIGEFSDNSIAIVQLLGNSDGDTVGPISVCRGEVDHWGGKWTGGVHLTNSGYKDAVSESVKVFVDDVEKSANGIYYGDTICIDAVNRLYIPHTVSGADLSSATECFLENRLWTLTDKMNVKVTLKTLNDIYVTLYYGCQIYRYDMTELYAPNNKTLIQYPIQSKVVFQTKEQKVLYKNGNHRYEVEVKPYGLGTFEDNDGVDSNIGYFISETFGKDYFVLIKNNSAYKLNQGEIICWEADYNYYIG